MKKKERITDEPLTDQLIEDHGFELTDNHTGCYYSKSIPNSNYYHVISVEGGVYRYLKEGSGVDWKELKSIEDLLTIDIAR